MEPQDITRVLIAHRQGDAEAFGRLMPMVYEDLRRIARRQLRRMRPGQTLNTTGLVHEAYVKLVDQTRASWQDRGHFFAIAARAMRQILVDFARQRSAEKRGGGKPHVALDDVDVAAREEAEKVLELDNALQALADIDERMVRVVECRFFAGFTEEETAEALGVSVRTVQRDWLRARAWLKTEMQR